MKDGGSKDTSKREQKPFLEYIKNGLHIFYMTSWRKILHAKQI